jgi:GAF domain-containing protein
MNGFLSALTLLTDFIAMTISLWLAFYLFGKGYPNQIALRAVVVFLSLALFFFGAFDSQNYSTHWDAELRAVAIVFTLTAWYGLTYQIIINNTTTRIRRYKLIVYALGVLSALLLLVVPNVLMNNPVNSVDVAHMQPGLPYFIYGGFLLIAGGGISYNLLSGNKVGLQPQGRYFLMASSFASIGAIYGAVALAYPLPRLFLDLFAFASVVFLGIAVARQRALIDRRILVADVPVSAFTIPGMAVLYAIIVWKAGYQLRLVAVVAVFAVLTHSAHSLAREFLERLRLQNEGVLRRKIHELEDSTERDFSYRLKVGLGLLCQALQASGGFVAIRQGDEFIVAASRQSSLQIDVRIAYTLVACEDVSPIANTQLPEVTWIAPAFEGPTQVAVIGLAKPKARLNYSSDDLDLLGEVAGQIGTLVSLNHLKSDSAAIELSDEIDPMASTTDEMMMVIASNPDREFVKSVEEALRHLSDYVTLGQSPLVEQLGIQGESHIERGKALSKKLIESIESLHPGGTRPPEPLPRAWYNYVVLHDAYVEGLPNREIMSRLYVSEGTFHRTRRNAVRGLARVQLEVTHASS